MKNPIKNGKEVFAVLSVATVMSLSMSVKTHAASSESKIDLAAENAYTETIIEDITRRGYADFAEASQELKATDFIGLGGELEFGDEIIPAALRAPQEATDPNYSEDEKKIQDYSGSERYRETDLQPGDTNQEFNSADEKEEKDGFKFQLKNPSDTSPSKTEYGYQITIDKEKGQRTYTKIYVTDSGLIPLDKGNKPMMGQGEKLTPESPDITYKPGENAIIDGAGKQRNLTMTQVKKP